MFKLIYCSNLPDLSFNSNSSDNKIDYFNKFSSFNLEKLVTPFITFYDYANFSEIITILYNLFHCNNADVANCYYTDSFVIHQITDKKNPNKYVFVKRAINDNDYYTLAEKELHFIDMTINDLMTVIKHTYIRSGLHILQTNDIYQIDFFIDHINTEDKNNFIDKLIVKENDKIYEIPFINFITILNNYNCDTEKAQTFINNYKNEQHAEFMLSQYNLECCILHCFFDCFKPETSINQQMTSFLKKDFYGDCFIGLLDNNYNNDFLDISIKTFMKLKQLLDCKTFHIKHDGTFYNLLTII